MKLLLNILDPTKYSYYLGTPDINLFWSSMLFGYIGVCIMVLMEVAGRNPNTTYSPTKFSWSYFWHDNAPRFLLNLILVAIFIRFLPDLLGKPMSQMYAFIVGLGSDKLATQLKSKEKAIFEDNTDTTTVTATTQTTQSVSVTTPVAAVEPVPAPVENQGTEAVTETPPQV